MSAPQARPASVDVVGRRALPNDPLARLGRMLEIRLLEDRILELFADGLIHGSTHTCQGQEAVAVGIAAAARPTDWVSGTYRGHGVALALGALRLITRMHDELDDAPEEHHERYRDEEQDYRVDDLHHYRTEKAIERGHCLERPPLTGRPGRPSAGPAKGRCCCRRL